MEMAKPVVFTAPVGKAMALPSSLETAEVETALPFESVRAAVSLFGGQIRSKKSTFLEKRAAQDAELLHAQEELLKLKELLQIADREKEKALHELAEAKKDLECANESLKKMTHSKAIAREGFGSEFYNAPRSGHGHTDTEEKYVVWESKLKSANEKHMAALAEMESVRQELEDLKQELLASSTEQDATFEQTRSALVAMEGSLKGAKNLTTDLAGINNWLGILKLACFEVCKPVTQNSSSGRTGEPQIGNQRFEMANEFEFKLLAMMNESIRVREELKSVKDGEAKGVSAALEVLANIEAMRLELEKLNKSAGQKKERSCNRGSLLDILESLKIKTETVQKELVDLKERETNAAVESAILSAELSKLRVELKETDSKAIASISQLSQALKQAEADAAKAKAETEAVREEVSRVRSHSATTEAKSIVSISQLSQALKQTEADLAEAKEETQALREEVFKARGHNAATEAEAMESITQLSQALKRAEAEAANMKVGIEALQEEVSRAQSRNAATEAKAIESIAQLSRTLKQSEREATNAKEEMEALREEVLRARSDVEQVKSAMQTARGMPRDNVQEADATRAANEDARIASVMSAQMQRSFPSASKVETGCGITISDQEYESLKRKLHELEEKLATVDQVSALKSSKEEISEEMENIKTALKQALHRAEMAETGKLSVESELKRLREREQRRKEKFMALTTQQNPTKNHDNEQSSSLPQKPHSEPLGNVLNIKISAERTKTLVRIGSHRHKKPTKASSFGSCLSKNT